MSKLISKDSVAGAQSWRPPSMGDQTAAESQAPGGGVITASQIEELQKQAYDEAYAIGLQEGRKAGEAEWGRRLQLMEEMFRSLERPFEELDAAVEEELVALVIALVKQLVRREIRSDPGQVIAVVREAVGILPVASGRVRLHLHPEDAALVRETLSLSDDEQTWTVVDDPVLSRGGCRVHTEHSQVDASVEARINQLIAQVFGGERESDEV